jgi:5'-3' exonuclease
MNYLIVDLANTFHRARHGASRANSPEEKVGFAIHVTLSSIAKCWREQNANHVVIALEGRSWRKDFYQPYKRNRSDARAAASASEQMENQMFWDASDDLAKFLRDRTNCTVLQHDQLEADDLIAGWVQLHPDDQHVIVSSDTDYVQLLTTNVKQYNGVSDELITLDGIFDGRGRPVKDRKTGEAKSAPDPAWLLFEKCMRGDTSDNVFSAYPGVRTKGSKNKVGLTEAFADRHARGWAYNNLMLQRWTDHLNQEHRVLDDYNRNRILVDLTAQPPEIRQLIEQTVQGAQAHNRPMVGAQFLKFCGRYDLVRLSENSTMWGQILSSGLEEK